MAELKNIIAQNLIALRKEKKLTQNELAEKLNYSDNTISRWEHAEITPSVETLEQIAKFYNVSVESILKEEATEESKKAKKFERIKHISTILMIISQVWFIAAVCFFYANTFANFNAWIFYVWAVPISMLIALLFSVPRKNHIVTFIFATLLVWSVISALYLQFLQYNLYLLFIIGVPTQLFLCVWAFMRPKKKK